MPDFSLVNASGLSKPADTLVTKISNAIGRHFDPRQTVRMAEAEARADRIRRVGAVETDIEIAELRERAAYRFANEEMTKQLNMESIIVKALQRVDDNANPGAMENDWIMNFFDKCRMVSDDDMQQIWAGILAGEANNPGSFSRKAVNLMSDLDKRDAQLFTNLCRFVWSIDSRTELLVLELRHDVYGRHGINFDSISYLESLGLVHYEIMPFNLTRIPKRASAVYHDMSITLTFPKDAMNDLSVGHALLTTTGYQLFEICRPEPVEGFFEYVYDRWVGEGLVPPREPVPAETASVNDDDTQAKIEDMLEYRQLASHLRRRVASLTEQYPDQWVALTPGDELFIANTMEELLAVLDEKGLRDGNVAIEFLDSNPAQLIL